MQRRQEETWQKQQATSVFATLLYASSQMMHLGLSSCEVETDAVSTRVFVGAAALAVAIVAVAAAFFLYVRFLGGSTLVLMGSVVKNRG